jgi:hypothetical protein
MLTQSVNWKKIKYKELEEEPIDSRSLTMAELDISQIVVSTGASICAGVSFSLWLFIISDGNSARLASLSQKPIILAQAVVGLLILTGLLVSIALSVCQPVYRGGEYFLENSLCTANCTT